MWYKKIINLLLILILLFSVLPLKQVGNILCKNVLTEEVTDTPDAPEKKGDEKFEIKKYTSPFYQPIDVHATLIASIFYGHYPVPIPLWPVADVHTPPPNFI